MDLRHVRTFVTVAELGTVSKAALHLRIAQPALSRQISDFERELGLELFERVGRRILLTSEGEQLLGDCRALLNTASAVGERAQVIRGGDCGVLKVAASPQHIESVFSQFLPRYARRFPNVQVKVSEGSGSEILAMLERSENSPCSESASCCSPGYAAFRDPSAGTDRIARCLSSTSKAWRSRQDRGWRPRPLSSAVAQWRVWVSTCLRRGLPPRGRRAESSVRKPRPTHLARAG